jgi:molybdopterin synthase catalytic subunit
MIEITKEPISPELLVSKVKTDGSGCAVVYIGLIRQTSEGKPVLSVEYRDPEGKAGDRLWEIATRVRHRWQIENIAISHRVGKLMVGDINFVVAIAAAHRADGFAACQYVIDQFKEKLPTRKTETYRESNMSVGKQG